MHELELKFRDAAARDEDVYLPNFTPTGPVDAVLIAMEPSLGRWVRNPTEAAAKVDSGLRNFMGSLEGFILHFTIRRYLLRAGESYHLTDVSKVP
jgi:hypothetical protein